MALLKDELMEATGLSEEDLKKRLLKNPPTFGFKKAEADAEQNRLDKDSWAYITTCYTPSDNTLLDRMLAVVK